LSNLTNFILTIVAAGIGSLVGSQLGQWQFRSQRWWDKKAETYLSIIDGFHPLFDEADEYWEAEIRHSEIPEERRKELWAISSKALAEIDKRKRLGSFLISQDAEIALKEMGRGLNRARMEMDSNKYMEIWSEALSTGFES
jgi:hypothetical protein